MENFLELPEENFNAIMDDFDKVIAKHGLKNRMFLAEAHFKDFSPLDDNCRDVRVCEDVTDPRTGRVHKVCHTERRCD